MSGMEPLFMAEAFAPELATAAATTLGTEVGTATLLSEVASGVGTGMAMGLPTLGAAFTPTVMNGLATLAPDLATGLAGTIVPNVAPALTGLTSAQGAQLLNQTMPGMLSPDQIAQMTKGATDIVANAQTLGQVAQAPTITQTGMQSVYDAIPKMPTEQLLSQTPVAETPFTANSSLYDLKAPAGYSELNAPMSNLTPSKYALGNQLADYKLAGSVPSGAATQTAAAQPGLIDKGLAWIKENPFSAASMAMNASKLLGGGSGGTKEDEKYSGPLSKFKYDPSRYTPLTTAPPTPYTPVYKDYRRYAGGGPIEAMSNANAVGANTGYPMADINKGAYATPYQTPISRNVITDTSDTGVNPMTGEMAFARGGIADLGGYSDGGRMLKGPGDGMSDNIPATIAGKQPARLANEEFVIPADVVSHLGNGSSDAGAKQLYKMMDRVRQARTGKKAQGTQINAAKLMPA